MVHGGMTLALLVIVVWRLLLPALRAEHFGIAFDAEGGFRIQDFAGNLAFAKAFWAGKASYDVDSHLRLTSEWAGQPVRKALPFLSSPTMLWILAPLCPLPTAWAYAAWTLLGVAAVEWMIRPPRPIWLAAALFSPAAFACFALGQTTVLTVAGMLFLMRDAVTDGVRRRRTGAISDCLDALVLWAMTAKPPVALTAGVALLGSRRWRAVAIALCMSAISTALLAPRLGIGGLSAYVHSMPHADVQTADPAFAWSLAPETMGNLRALLYVPLGIGDAAASRWSGAVWIVAMITIIVSGIRHAAQQPALWGFAVLAYLLFCPHVSATGDLHLALLLVLLEHPPAVRWSAVGLTLAALTLLPQVGLYDGALRLPVVLASKALLAGLVWTQWRPSPGQARPASPSPAVRTLTT